MKYLKKTVAVLAALTLIFSFTACGEDVTTATTAAPEATTAASVEESTTAPETEAQTTEAVTESTAQATTTEAPATTEVTTTTKPTTANVTTTKAATTKKAVTTTQKAVTTTSKATVPSTKAEIVALYNNAAATAASAKPAYSKTNSTALSNLQMGALAKIDAVRETVGDFLGEGTSTTVIKKGSFNGKDLVKSTLKDADVVSASCTPTDDGKYYNIKITVKTETNPAKSGSALGRFTKDFKDITEIKEGLTDAGAGVESVTLKTTSVVITAKIEAATNRFVSLDHTFKMSAVLTNVKYSIAKVKSASADLTTTVKYSSFKY